MALLGLATGGLFALASAPEDSVHNLGHFTHLFVDDSLLLSRVNLSLSLNPPVVDPEPIVGPDQPWELASGSVRPSPHPTATLPCLSGGKVASPPLSPALTPPHPSTSTTQLHPDPQDVSSGNVLPPAADGEPWRMWYQLQTNVSDMQTAYIPASAYAESHDGVHWRKPLLNVTMFAGSVENNVVMWGIKYAAQRPFVPPCLAPGRRRNSGSNISAPCPVSVWEDPNAPPHQRFKTQGEFYVGFYPKISKVFRFSASPDGIHW